MESVSIVIPIHDRKTHLEKLMFFLNRWQKDIDFEVIVSDDNSKEDIKGLCESMKNEYPFEIKYTGYHYDEPHLFRLAKARNEGAKLATKDFLLVMDGDRILQPNYLKKSIDIWNNHGRNCVIGGRTIYLHLKPEDIPNDCEESLFLNKNNIETQDRCLIRFAKNKETDITDHFWYNLYGGGIFIERSTYEQIGGNNEEFEGYGHEDNDFALKVRRSGKRILLSWNTVMYHMYHPVYHSSYNNDEFYNHYKKMPGDYLHENFRRYRDMLTPEELREERV